MAGNTDGDGEELSRWVMLPAGIWMLRTGWGLTAVALALNLLNLPGVCRTASKIHNGVGVLWMFGAPFALALTIGCALALWLRRRAVTRRGALLWVSLAFVSLAAFPLSPKLGRHDALVIRHVVRSRCAVKPRGCVLQRRTSRDLMRELRPAEEAKPEAFLGHTQPTAV
jgi:hypothetical protein